MQITYFTNLISSQIENLQFGQIIETPYLGKYDIASISCIKLNAQQLRYLVNTISMEVEDRQPTAPLEAFNPSNSILSQHEDSQVGQRFQSAYLRAAVNNVH